MARIILSKIAKRFGEVEVLKPLDLEAEDGEFLVLLGPSGCGKSTTLRILAGLEEPTSGSVWIGDRDVTHLPPKDRDVAMVFQSYALYPHLTVRGNLGFGLKVRGADRREIEERTGEAASLLGLGALLDRKPRELSGGQRQRVAMGRALVRRPKVFLFDEPLSNLDAALRTQMRAEIARLHARLKITTVYVTHDQVEAMTLASRIAILEGGVLQQVGAPLDVYARPASGFVGRFLGTPAMNQIPGVVLEGPVFDSRGVSVPLPERARVHSGKPIVLGVRPQALRFASPDVSMIRGEVELIEPTGGESFVRVRVSDGMHVTARFEGPVYLRMGDAVGLDVPDPSQLHLFSCDNRGEAGEALM